MSETPQLSNNYKTWDVKLLWIITYPSSLYAPGNVTPDSFELFGVERDSIVINRPKTKISSLEQIGQGWQKGIPSYSINTFTKESGTSYEKMRRLSALDIPFDISEVLASDSEVKLEDNPHVGIWIEGYEVFLGCTVVNERSNHNIAEFPLREFECQALRHYIMETEKFEAILEGDGTYKTEWPGKS